MICVICGTALLSMQAVAICTTCASDLVVLPTVPHA